MYYSDYSVLNSGKHKGKMLFEVPAEYLMNLLHADHPNNNQSDKDLIDYIRKNGYAINNRDKIALAVIQDTAYCKKLPYPTKKDATFDLNRIRSKNQAHKIPVRAYECEFCSQWHLTSISYEEYKRLERSKQNAILSNV